MSTTIGAFAATVYAGVLGKILGVYLGRPVEGWSYPSIRERFGQIEYFVHRELGVPLIVPDDDISGTFVFTRALEDSPRALASGRLFSDEVADAWLNYIVEGRTVLWWGGLSRSTEHTVFLRLKQGIRPPRSGSIALNGASMAEQVGAQIFIDGWGLVNPGDPERAVAMARNAARVSHDGLAVDAAALIAGMEAEAFVQPDLSVLLDDGLQLVSSARLSELVDEVRTMCREHDDWRATRDEIERRHGYHRYPSNSPVQTNHAAVIMSLLYGGDSWQRSVSICTSAGWDTDSNTGNVGCLNGIRLGLAGLARGADFRTPAADRLFAVSADGGEVVTDAVRETRKLLRAAAAVRRETVEVFAERFAFEFPGSRQGWVLQGDGGPFPAESALDNPDGGALHVCYRRLGPGTSVRLAVATGPDPRPRDTSGTSEFGVLASPTLYSGQRVEMRWRVLSGGAVMVRPFVEYGDGNGVSARRYGAPVGAAAGRLQHEIPDTCGQPIHRFGLELTTRSVAEGGTGEAVDGTLALDRVDWNGAPRHYRLGRAQEMSPELTPWTTDTVWLRTFLSSAANLAPDYTTTFCVSHPDRGGVVTTGTADWADYTVASRIEFNRSDGAGLVARAKGHRRYYAVELRGAALQLLRVRDTDELVLAEATVEHEVDQTHDLALSVRGSTLQARWDGHDLLHATDDSYSAGGAGFVVHGGAFLAEGFEITAEEPLK